MILARGMRNNNPLNIIKSEKINWQGEVKPSTDPNFAQFETLEYGLRAAFKLLQTYYTKHGCKTITQIISRWAPETGARPLPRLFHDGHRKRRTRWWRISRR